MNPVYSQAQATVLCNAICQENVEDVVSKKKRIRHLTTCPSVLTLYIPVLLASEILLPIRETKSQIIRGNIESC